MVVVHVPADRWSTLPDYHLLVERDDTLALSVDDPVHHSRPSIDVLFDSVALAFGAETLGILLSGASQDGTEGAALALAPHLTADPATMGAALAAWGAERA